MKVLPEDFVKLFNERHFNILYQASTTDYQALMSEEEFVTYANDFKNNSGDFELKFHNSIHYKVDRYCFIDDNDTHMITAVFHQNGEIGGIQFDFHEQYETDDDYTKNKYKFPINDEWFVLWGGTNAFLNYHYPYKNQRYAYDLVQSISGHVHNGLEKKLSSYFTYGKDVVAPLKGEVVDVYLHQPDNFIGIPNMEQPMGNAVVLKHENDEYSMVAHLQAGSIVVRMGDTVEQGDLLGFAGNSGASNEPHLHFQVTDGRDLVDSKSLRIRFNDYEKEPVQAETVRGV